MNIKSLSLKNIIKDENNEEYFDLSVPSFEIANIAIKDFHAVTQDEEGRIDKIAYSYYGNTSYIDMLCFINHIYNPFSIKQNDILLIPEVAAYESKIYKKPVIPSWISGSEATAGGASKKTNEKDENRINRLKKQASRKANELQEGQSVKKYINGKIILGTNLNIKNG